MDAKQKDEISRLTFNAALHREDLLRTAQTMNRWRKILVICAGCLALLSAGTVSTVLTTYFAPRLLQLFAALGGIASGAISLVTAAYFSDTDVVTLLSGSSKYLALRETVGRLALNPRLSDADRFEELAELQGEYVRLDETYSRYFHYAHGRGSKPPGQYGGWSARAYNIAREITDNLVGKL